MKIVDFTREPIIETVITPKEGCKLVVRSSKSTGQEEYFVDALEVVSFGHSFFFRSLERPKTFLVPATDYEVLEVREARMVLKSVGIDKQIKIGGGREGHGRAPKESVEKTESFETAEEVAMHGGAEGVVQPATAEKLQESRLEKKRDRRRQYRRRRGREGEEEGSEVREESGEVKKTDESTSLAQQVVTTSILTSLLPPPPTLISETIASYKDKFKEAFFNKEEAQKQEEKTEEAPIPLPQPEYGSFELSEEEEEEIYKQRKSFRLRDEDQEEAYPSSGETVPDEQVEHPNLDTENKE